MDGSHSTGHMTSNQAIRFVKNHGIVLESARGSVPNLAETITGKRMRGSWWAHPKRQEIFLLTRAVRASEDILVCRVVRGKITYVHRRLWPALVRLAKQLDGTRLGRIREIHAPRGEHDVQTIPYPRRVPAEVKFLARNMSDKQAISSLGEWYFEGRSHGAV
jgi:hypothetical protein